VHPDLLDEEQLTRLFDELVAVGVENFVVQHCVARNCREPRLRQMTAARTEAQFFDRFKNRFTRFAIRG